MELVDELNAGRVMQAPAISAVITTYQRPESLRDAVKSVLGQSVLPSELIIIDNNPQGSAALDGFDLPPTSPIPVRVVNEARPGVSAARNRGFDEARGHYVAFLDDDDEWCGDHLENFLERRRMHPDAVIFGGRTTRTGGQAGWMHELPPSLMRDYSTQSEERAYLRPCAPLARPFYTPHMSSSVILRSAALSIRFCDELRGREDILFVWQMGRIGDVLIDARLHASLGQLEISLFSLPGSASQSEIVEMNLKKAYWGVRMFEQLYSGSSMPASTEMSAARAQASFDYAYFASAAGLPTSSLKQFSNAMRRDFKVARLRFVLTWLRDRMVTLNGARAQARAYAL